MGIPMKAFFAYTLLLVGMPVFVGMFVGSFVMRPLSRILDRLPRIERTHLQFPEVFNGLAAAVAGAVYFRVCGLTPNLIVPLIIAAWVSLYCIASHQHLPHWLSWLAGLVIGWLAMVITVLAA